jgi:hypothetical protein
MNTLLNLELEKVFVHIDHFFGIKSNPYVTYSVKMFIYVTKESIENIYFLGDITFNDDQTVELYEKSLENIKIYDNKLTTFLLEMINTFIDDVETLQKKIIDCIQEEGDFPELMRDLTYNTIISKELKGEFN